MILKIIVKLVLDIIVEHVYFKILKCNLCLQILSIKNKINSIMLKRWYYLKQELLIYNRLNM
jgi:hypothetical protein